MKEDDIKKGFFKRIYKKSFEEIIVHRMHQDKASKKNKPTDYALLLGGRLVRLGYHVIYEYELEYSDGTTYYYDLFVEEFPYLLIDVDDSQYHELPEQVEKDKNKDCYTEINYRRDVVRILNGQIENDLDLVTDWLIGRGTISNQAALEVGKFIEREKILQEERIRKKKVEDIAFNINEFDFDIDNDLNDSLFH